MPFCIWEAVAEQLTGKNVRYNSNYNKEFLIYSMANTVTP